MKGWTPILAVLINILAVTAPVAALYARYGFDVRVSAHQADQLFSLAGAMLSAFGLALIASRLLHQMQNSYTAVLRSITETLRSENQHRRAA